MNKKNRNRRLPRPKPALRASRRDPVRVSAHTPAQLEDRIRALEAENRQLRERLVQATALSLALMRNGATAPPRMKGWRDAA